MRVHAMGFVCVTAMQLGACAELNRGPDPIMTPMGGVAITDVTGGPDVITDFVRAELAAREPAETDIQVREMLRTGLDLVRFSCNAFLDGGVSTQRLTIFFRDVVATTGGFATALLTANGASRSNIGAVGVGTAVTYAGLDVHARNFLFGADSVREVKRLTLRVLDTHRAATDALLKVSYADGVWEILYAQDQCSPQAITDSVKKAIASGDVAPLAKVDAQSLQDEIVRGEIGGRLGTTAVSLDQLGGLYWLLNYGTRNGTTDAVVIRDLLRGLPRAPQGPVNATEGLVSDSILMGEIDRLLKRLSPAMRSQLDRAINQSRNQTVVVIPPAPPVQPDPAPRTVPPVTLEPLPQAPAVPPPPVVQAAPSQPLMQTPRPSFAAPLGAPTRAEVGVVDR